MNKNKFCELINILTENCSEMDLLNMYDWEIKIRVGEYLVEVPFSAHNIQSLLGFLEECEDE